MCVSICLSICLSAYLSVCLSVHLSVHYLGDFLDFRSWQHETWSTSGRFPRFWKLTTWKMQQFCEASFTSGASFNNGKLCVCRADGLALLQFTIFPVHVSEYCTCRENARPGHTKCCTCHTKSSQQTWRYDAPRCNNQDSSALTPEHVRWTCLSQLRQNLQVWLILTRFRILCACHTNRHPNFKKCSENDVLCTF